MGSSGQKRRFRVAVGLSIALHALLLAALAWLATAPLVPALPTSPLTVLLVPRPDAPFPVARPEGSANWVHMHASPDASPTAAPAVAGRSPAAAPGAGGTSGGDEAAATVAQGDLRDRIDQRLHDDTFAPPPEGTGVRARQDGAYGSETDSIDGIAHLGSGEPGDPRIPGSGGIDIGKVIARDGIVLGARTRADRGQVPKFLADAKDRIETCWLPTAADANAVQTGWQVPDRGCAIGFHLRHRVGRVFVVYDAGGNRLSMDVVDVTVARDLIERVADAVTRAGMPAPPKELLGADGTLRVAWNVYIDDFRHCGLIGRGANADKPGGDKIIGIVELDGVY